VVVTGAGGFLGRAVLEVLLDQRTRVVAIGRRAAAAGPHVRWVCCDLAGDVQQLRSVPGVEEAVAVLHLAAPSRRRFVQTPDSAAAELAAIDACVIDACLSSPAMTRIVVASSCAVYGDRIADRRRLDEAMPLRPTSAYGLAKQEQERRWADARLDRPLVTARLFNLTGPGEPDTLVCAAIAARLRGVPDGSPFPVSNSESVRDFVDVRDAAAALVTLARSPVVGALNVCDGVPRTIAEVARTLVAISGRRVQLDADGAGADSWSVGDPSRLLAATTWRPRRSLQESLAAVWSEAPAAAASSAT
jgi:nucleoside-diphosphate-sugar epimerase